MNVIDTLRDKKSKKFVIYIMAGDPNMAVTEKLIYLMEKEGVSLVEIGVPFSDPVADGPVIQKAGERALKKGINIKKALVLVKKVRKKGVKIPLVFMTYYNIIHSFGPKKFTDKALSAGLNGVIIPDLPFDEEKFFHDYAKKKGFYIIQLVSPSNTPGRIKKIVEKSRGFVYYILLKGVTGAGGGRAPDSAMMKKIGRMADNPVFAGFGISGPKDAKKVLKAADGVIIGSAFIKIIEKAVIEKKNIFKAAKKYIRSFRGVL